MSEDQKQCSKCGEWKSLEQMRKNRNYCKDCQSAWRREYYQRNKKRARTYNLEYYAKPGNRERLLKYLREYRIEYDEKNKDSIRARKHEYRKNNREYLRKKQRGYRNAPNMKSRQRIYKNNRRARERSLPHTFTQDEWQHALNHFNGCCAVCGRQMNDMFGEFKAAADHWIPLSYEGEDNPGTVAKNIIPLCDKLDGCNNSKGAKMPNEWLEWKFGKRKTKKIAARIQEYFDSITIEDNQHG